MVFKGVLDDAFAGQPVNVEDLYSEANASVTGFIFLTSAFILAKWGGNNKGAGASFAVAALGWGLMAYETIQKNHNDGSTIGALTALASVSYGVFRAIQREQNAKKEESVLSEKGVKTKSAFRQNIDSVLEKYPYLIVGAVDLVSVGLIANGAVGVKDGVLAGITALWATGATLLTLCAPKVDKKQLQPS